MSEAEEHLSFAIHFATNYTIKYTTNEDIEKASKCIANFLQLTHNNDHNSIKRSLRTCLEDLHNYGKLQLVFNEKPVIVFVFDKWLFEIVLLQSCQSFTVLFKEEIHEEFIRELALQAIRNLSPFQILTLQIIKFLEFTLKKCPNYFDEDLSKLLLNELYVLKLSPFQQLRNCDLTKSLLKLPCKQFRFLKQTEYIPIRNIDSKTLLNLYSKNELEENFIELIEHVIKLFESNITNREASFVYEKLVQNCETFSSWKTKLWSVFKRKFFDLELEGEFFQSLLKYWIPITVKYYKSDLYFFIRNQPIHLVVKSYILLETKRQSFFLDDFRKDALFFLNNSLTFNQGFAIYCFYSKKICCNDFDDLNCLLKVLNNNCKLDGQTVKSLKGLLSHIFYFGHFTFKQKNHRLIVEYVKFFLAIKRFCLNAFLREDIGLASMIIDLCITLGECSSNELQLNYSINKNQSYNFNENELFLALDFKHCPKIINCIKTRVHDNISQSYNVEFDKLILKYYPSCLRPIGISCIMESITISASLQNLENFCNFINLHFQACWKTESNVNVLLIFKNALQANLRTLKSCYEDKIVFESILHLVVLNCAQKNDFTACEDIIIECLSFIQFAILNIKETKKMNYKSLKILESFVNNALELCLTNKINWKRTDLKFVINCFLQIITESNMRRPTSLAAEALKNILLNLRESGDDTTRLQLLKSTLIAINDSSSKLSLSIRRSPESRLIIEAICSSGLAQQGILVNWTVQYLIDVISNDKSSDSAIVSALHCLESIVSLEQSEFIPEILIRSIKLFEKPSFSLRNANLQLVKTILEQFYGVIIGENNRAKCYEDLFRLYPAMSIHFYKTLLIEPLNESSIIVFQFFIESQIKKTPYNNRFLNVARQVFQEIFTFFIKNYSGIYGMQAVKALTALCHEDEIPQIFCEVIDFVVANYDLLRKNIFNNCVNFLRELWCKYALYHFGHLKILLHKWNYFRTILFEKKSDFGFYDLIGLPYQRVDQILCRLESYSFTRDKFEDRIWLNNNIPFAVRNCRDFSVLNSLRLISLPKHIHVQILSIILEKYKNNSIQNVLPFLYDQAFALDSNEIFLCSCYCRVILITTHNNNFTIDFSENYKIDNEYKTLIKILPSSGTSKEFLEANLLTIINNSLKDDSMAFDVSTILPWLYENISCKSRFHLMKLIFHLLLSKETLQNCCYFFEKIYQQSICSAVHAFQMFFNYDLMFKTLSCKRLVIRLFLECYYYLNSLPDDLVESSNTYYMIKQDLSVPKTRLLFLLKDVLVSCKEYLQENK